MKVLSTLVMLISLVAGFAGQARADSDLGGVMKAMAESISRISQPEQIGDPSKNADSAQVCDALIASIEQAKAFMPKKVSKLPADQQDAQIAEFVRQLDGLEEKVTEMKNDFIQNDNNAAKTALAEVLVLKAAGHKAFR